TGPLEGSLVRWTLSPRPSSRSESALATVVFPEPSMPSMTKKRGMGDGVWGMAGADLPWGTGVLGIQAHPGAGRGLPGRFTKHCDELLSARPRPQAGLPRHFPIPHPPYTLYPGFFYRRDRQQAGARLEGGAHHLEGPGLDKDRDKRLVQVAAPGHPHQDIE